jgi:hypothetical protein
MNSAKASTLRIKDRMKNSLLAMLVSLVVSQAFGQGEIRKYTNDFLNIGVGARGMGMGNAQVASTEDVYSGYYNPAGLANIPNTFQVGLMHSEYFAGIALYDYASFAVPMPDKQRVFGFSFFRFGVDNIPNTLFLIGPDGSINYNNITSFSTADYAFMLHYAQKFKVPGLTAGGTAKIIYRSVGPFGHALGFGIDLGLQYRKKGWRAGLMLRDITTTFDAWSFSFTDAEKQALLQTNNDLPKNSIEYAAPVIILGGAYEANIKNKFFILPEINAIFSTDGKRNVLLPGKPISMDLVGGLELSYAHIGYIRAGVSNIQQYYAENGKHNYSLSPSIGAGIRIKVIAIDYTLTNLTAIQGSSQNNGLYSHVISLRLDINVKKKPVEPKEEVK